MEEARYVEPNDFSIYECEHWRVQHCSDIAIPGYLILEPVILRQSLSALDIGAQSSLGQMLILCVRAVEQAVEPERVYTACFNETNSGVHFHIFPRTHDMNIFGVRPDIDTIDGPMLLSQVRHKMRAIPASAVAKKEIKERIIALRAFFANEAIVGV
ncbi:hypothetical protein ELI44_36305 [Rhizobium ruizarguesonis]|jgi:diadenosine tetraphosphate (Ap4A) HIT family hydrolase|uniref:HIT family protein n=1 Tax=Rhizobium ruizarguesonis TaxID=2081791 RepID=UPI001030006A|nr:hypothetical protein [Rhizobium ruizarguesonis]NKQ85618.1 hypothetical protein [Rhizobium ruizarguesonis]TAU35554.1 hypothetical protein ELI42_36390 [Rhizobium ruizarguesonis]TAU45962.1 hypothetical protein ELI44_36305 [Rhizobium ruizarguesonis]